ncbi:MAG: hypothetical protein M1814_003240 [Vezdaea aestivalis]|nr:MAG: hypothetical protein M1814_003240 [Vezdaea aestivalis]
MSGPPKSQIFKGLKFCFNRYVPRRSELVTEVTVYGGTVVGDQSDADYVIYDHQRRPDVTADNYVSYTFLERSMEYGRLEYSNDHLVHVYDHTGPASRRGRMNYTREEDVDLWVYVQHQKRRGRPISGNKMYEEYAAVHNRHSFQSWRDRWMKTLRKRPPPVGAQERYSREIAQFMNKSANPTDSSLHVAPAAATAATAATGRVRHDSRESSRMTPVARSTVVQEFVQELESNIAIQTSATRNSRTLSGPEQSSPDQSLNRQEEAVARSARALFDPVQSSTEQPLDAQENTRRRRSQRVQSEGATDVIPVTPMENSPVIKPSFTKDDLALLARAAPAALLCGPADSRAGWQQTEEVFPQHTAAEWEHFFWNDFIKKPHLWEQLKISPAQSTTGKRSASPVDEEIPLASAPTVQVPTSTLQTDPTATEKSKGSTRKVIEVPDDSEEEEEEEEEADIIQLPTQLDEEVNPVRQVTSTGVDKQLIPCIADKEKPVIWSKRPRSPLRYEPSSSESYHSVREAPVATHVPSLRIHRSFPWSSSQPKPSKSSIKVKIPSRPAQSCASSSTNNAPRPFVKGVARPKKKIRRSKPTETNVSSSARTQLSGSPEREPEQFFVSTDMPIDLTRRPPRFTRSQGSDRHQSATTTSRPRLSHETRDERKIEIIKDVKYKIGRGGFGVDSTLPSWEFVALLDAGSTSLRKLEEWIEEQQSAGCQRQPLDDILRGTTNDLDCASEVVSLVIEDQRTSIGDRGNWHGLLRGWWTQEDDERLCSCPLNSFDRSLSNKHGVKAYEQRRKFLKKVLEYQLRGD